MKGVNTLVQCSGSRISMVTAPLGIQQCEKNIPLRNRNICNYLKYKYCSLASAIYTYRLALPAMPYKFLNENVHKSFVQSPCALLSLYCSVYAHFVISPCASLRSASIFIASCFYFLYIFLFFTAIAL